MGKLINRVMLSHGALLLLNAAMVIPSVALAQAQPRENRDRGGALNQANFGERYVFQGDPALPPVWTTDRGDRRQYIQLTLREDSVRANGGLRSEIVPKREYIQAGVRIYGISFKMPDDWLETAAPILLAQLHTSQKADTVSPPLAIVARGGRLHLETRTSTAQPSLGQRLTRDNIQHAVHDLGPLPLGRWTCFVFRMNWAFRAGEGETTVWMNGDRVFESKDEPNAYETWLGNYPKVGLYAPWKLGARERHILVDGIWLDDDRGSMRQVYRLTPCAEGR